MLIAQVVKPGFYIDYKVRSLEDIPWHFIPFVKTIGEEKYGTNDMCYVIIRLRRMESSDIRGGDYLRATAGGKGEGAGEGNDGGIGGSNSGLVRSASSPSSHRRGDLVWWCSRKEDYLVPSLSFGREGVHVVDARQVVKLDVDVDVTWYDPNWLLEKKLSLLHALGYREEKAWWELSPSGRHVHLIIVLPSPLSTKELFDLQFLLGDDPKRVEFNYLRYNAIGEDAIHFNVLYAYKKSLTRVDKLRAIFRHWARSLQYSKKRNEGQMT
ncbi:hypothetical protein AFV7_gp24 [Betalipothrixvirus pezzuloense]|uniref:Uncharacterized protein n=1 Tax=Betalipothrixvirus pezzuloense TaxID=346883 RepID=A7WKP3_9VIRU|nr:hypothetical protein AFV7_gp24 [Acidianus filamentous virus 7]CAJ31643.1 conserved hypothetical protein [Acidianus filamentous virus 7]